MSEFYNQDVPFQYNNSITVQVDEMSVQNAINSVLPTNSDIEPTVELLKNKAKEIVQGLENNVQLMPSSVEVGFKEVQIKNVSQLYQVPQITLSFDTSQMSGEKLILSARTTKDQNKQITGLDIYNEAVCVPEGDKVNFISNDEIGKSNLDEDIKQISSFLSEKGFVNYDVQYKNRQALEEKGLMPLAERLYDGAKDLYKDLKQENVNTGRLIVDITEHGGYIYPNILATDHKTNEMLQLYVNSKELQETGKISITSTRIKCFDNQKSVEHINADSPKLNAVTKHLYKTGEVSKLYDLSKKINRNLEQAGQHLSQDGQTVNDIYAKYVPASEKNSERLEIKGTKESGFNQVISLFETESAKYGKQISARATTFQNGQVVDNSYINNSSDVERMIQNNIVKEVLTQAVPKLRPREEHYQQKQGYNKNYGNQNNSYQNNYQSHNYSKQNNNYQQKRNQDFNR